MIAGDHNVGDFQGTFVEVFGPILGGALEVPYFDFEGSLGREGVTESDLVFVGGSTFVVAEIL